MVMKVDNISNPGRPHRVCGYGSTLLNLKSLTYAPIQGVYYRFTICSNYICKSL